MPEIYEIPNTSQVFTQNNVTTVRTNYIIKSEYTDLDLLHQKVQDFIYDNNIINTSISYSETENYYINFIENHNEDMIAEVCLFPNSSDQLYYTLWNKTENNKDGYNDVIEERSFYEALRGVAS